MANPEAMISAKLIEARTEALRTPKSTTAKRMFEDLMLLDPPTRQMFVGALTPNDLRHLLKVVTVESGTPFGLWFDDPVGFVTDVLGETIMAKQAEVLRSLVGNKITAVPSAVGMGKCVPCGEHMQLADGSVVTAESLVGREFHMLAWQEDGTQVVRRARAENNRVEPVYRVTTASGRTIVRNGHHPLWAADVVQQSAARRGDRWTTSTVPVVRGWTGVASLQPDAQAVLVPEHVHTVGDGWMRPEAARVLGYLLGDGGTTVDVKFSQLPGPALDEFVADVEALGGRVVELRSRSRATEVAVRGPEGEPNPVLALAREWGIFGCKATAKRIPAEVWRMGPDTIALIASRLFSCDGYVHVREESNQGARNDAYVRIELVNEGLVRDFHRAMLRLGVTGTVRSKVSKWNGDDVIVWSWTASSAEDLIRFAEVIDAPAKNAKIQRAAVVARQRKATTRWIHENAPKGYRWEKVVSVEEMPEEMTVSIEVDGEHTWVDLFVEHNTFIAARATLWRSLVFPIGTSLVVTTAPRHRQVRRLLWPHIRGAAAKAHLPVTVDSVQMRAESSSGKMTDIAYGFSAPPHDESAVQGIHHPRLLVVVDEAGGIAHLIGTAMRGILTGEETRLLAIGNPPTDDEGSWFEGLCTSKAANIISLSALDAPDFTGEIVWCRACPPEMPRHTITGHVNDRAWVNDTIEEHGKDSPYVISKVFAKFPKGGSARALPSTWVDLAAEATDDRITDGIRLCDLGLEDERDAHKVREGAWVRLGVDVAADGGDEFSISRCVGDLLTEEHASSGAANANPTDVAGVVLQHIQRAEALRARLGTEAPVRVKIDGLGVGWGVVGILTSWGTEGLHNAEIVNVIVSEGTNRVDDPHAHMRPWRKRDEMWLAMRSLLRPLEISGGTAERPEAEMFSRLRMRFTEKTLAQLRNPKYGTNASGFTVIESKKQMKARGMNSPDRAESALLCVYEPEVNGKGTGVEIITGA